MEEYKKTGYARQIIISVLRCLDKIDKGNSWEERDYLNEKMEKLNHELRELTMKGGVENGR